MDLSYVDSVYANEMFLLLTFKHFTMSLARSNYEYLQSSPKSDEDIPGKMYITIYEHITSNYNIILLDK